MEERTRKDLLVIIPAYNEEKNIGSVLERLEAPEISAVADIFVINDGSTDATSQVVKRHGHTVVTHVFNLGYGSALQLGYKYAVRRQYRYVIQMDADGQHDACNILRIYDRLRQEDIDGNLPDIVLGCRFMEGSKEYRMSAVRRFACLLFQKMIYIFTGRTLVDPTTGLQGLSRRAFSYYSKYKHYDDRYPDANMLIQMLLLGFLVEEVPATMHQRTGGVGMHSGLKPVIYMMRMFFSIIAVRLRAKRLKGRAIMGAQNVLGWKES